MSGHCQALERERSLLSSAPASCPSGMKAVVCEYKDNTDQNGDPVRRYACAPASSDQTQFVYCTKGNK